MRDWYKENRGRPMCRCGCAGWVPGEFGLQCERCGSLSEAARQAADRAAAAKRAEAEARVAAAAPTPREALKAIAGELAGARAEEARLEAAAAIARDQLAGARVALDVAEAALPAARQKIADEAVTALLSGKTKPPKTLAGEEAALEVARNGLELATTAADTLADMLADAGYQVRRLEKRHREAALAVLADEMSPLLIARASTARTEFIAASKGLKWLADAGVKLDKLIATELQWSWHHSPETWNAALPGPDLDTALSALLADPRASVADSAELKNDLRRG